MSEWQNFLQSEEPGMLLFGAARMALLDIEGGFWSLRRQLDALIGRRLTNGALQQAGANGGASFARSFIAPDDNQTVEAALRDCIAAYQAAGFGRFQIVEAAWPLGRVVVRGDSAVEAWMLRQHEQTSDSPACAYTAGVLVGFINALTDRRDIVCVERTCQACGDAACTFELLPADQTGDTAVVGYDPDPFLSQQLNLLDILFDRMPMGIAIIDPDYRLRRFNPTWAAFIEQYTPSPATKVAPGVSLFDLEPGTEEVLLPILDQVLAGETVRQNGLRLETGGHVSYWDVLLMPLHDNGRVAGILDVSLDATERVLAEQQLQTAYHTLEQRVEARTTELQRRADEVQTLFNVQQAINSRLDPDTVLQMIADEARRLTDTEMAAVYLRYGDEFEITVVSGQVSQEIVGYRLPVENTAAGLAVRQLQPILVADASDADQVHHDLVERIGAHSFIIVPLLSGQEAVGTITVANKRSAPLGPDDERVLVMMASGAVIALENARLYRDQNKRREIAEGLRDVLRVLNSNQPLAETLDTIIMQASQLMEAQISLLYRLDTARQHMFIEAQHGLPPEVAQISGFPLVYSPVDEMILARQPVASLIDHTVVRQTLPGVDPAVMRSWHSHVTDRHDAFLAIPLVVRDEVYGRLTFYYARARTFSQEDIDQAMLFGDQAALAIENARLRDNAEQMAVVAERNRLARELHDAVTQTLFSASLIADVLPRIWERSPETGQARLEELRELTRGALAEMRTLLLELRPATLTESSLDELLQQLAAAVIGRSRVQVAVQIAGEDKRPLPPDLQVALYRIAQEALNNVVKHAGATQVTVTLRFLPACVELVVADNGRGFNPDTISVHSLGLGIMRERAAKIGADLHIDSQVGAGTTLTVHVCA